MIHSDSTRLILAKLDEKVVGFLTLAIYQVPTGMKAWIEDIVVDEAHRRNGIGNTLVLHTVQLARDAGAKTVDLTSRSSREAAIKLYKKIGFHSRETNIFWMTLKGEN